MGVTTWLAWKVEVEPIQNLVGMKIGGHYLFGWHAKLGSLFSWHEKWGRCLPVMGNGGHYL